MSLLDKASLVVTPNAYKASKLYSVVPSDGTGDITVVRATTATRVNSAGLIESVAVNVPRIDYTNGSCPSLLVEPQRTNLITYSNDFSNWNNGGVTLMPNYATSPDGTLNATRYQANSGSYIYIGYTSTANLTHSVYVKSNTGVNQNIIFGGNTIETFIVTNQWKRIDISVIASEALTQISTSQTTDILIWGSQSEAGSYATSYIPTVASTVTRNVDVISKTGISSLIGQTEGTIFSSFYYNGNAINGIQIYPLYIGQGNYFDSISIGIYDDSLLCRIFKDGVNQNYFTSSALSIGNHKVAFVYAANNLKLFLDGVLIATDISAIIPICDQIYCSSAGTTTTTEKININNNILYKTALTDTECIALTTI